MKNSVQGKKLAVISLLTAFLAVIIAFSNGSVVKADEADGTANITLHKLQYSSQQESVQNTGGLMEFANSTPLNGAEFTVYDVTADYYSLLADSTTDSKNKEKAAIQTLEDKSATYATADKVVGAPQVTADEGTTTFNSLALKDDTGRDKVYLILETKTPNSPTVTVKSVPLVVSMPVYQNESNTAINYDIHLYPKNIVATDKKEIDLSNLTAVDGQGNHYSVDGTSKIKYSITVNVPADIELKDRFDVIDVPTEGLKYVEKSLEIAGLTEGTDYTIYAGHQLAANLPENYQTLYQDGFENGFYIKFNNKDSAAIQALAGKALVISYQMQIDSSIVPDLTINNTAYVSFDNTVVPNTPLTPGGEIVVETGGYKFHKVDSQTGKSLAKASFLVINKAGQYGAFTLTNGEYLLIDWKDALAEATTLVSTSTDKSNLAIKGLKYGEYKIQETVAPEGYALAKGAVTFEIAENSYTDAGQIMEIANTPKGILPSTGGSGIYLFLAVGVIAIAGGAFYFTKGRRKFEA
ncbi:SpaH/EbpB family LPXTG-anchored major pilin [Enterococcus sp. HY326]|uniref:SpaH/EbpB family LPXTG-anchored major pilin n=1 Tax=Enterococcus sp. HY326 TaxID=2971265 RepID=UPI00223F7EB3|nr:SpaH/EbpB family LPXTG-anchored major pilin [Enterococcus sp. HY326]